MASEEYGEYGAVLQGPYCEGIRDAAGDWVVRFDDDYGTDQMANAILVVGAVNARRFDLDDLKRRKALFDVAMASGYGMEEIGPDHAADSPPEDGDFVTHVLMYWDAIVEVLEGRP
jgi:hypothetical protein